MTVLRRTIIAQSLEWSRKALHPKAVMSTTSRSRTKFYTRNGESLTERLFLDAIAAEVKSYQSSKAPCVVLFGENHSDSEAHSVELATFEKLHSTLADNEGRQLHLALSLEFYDREAQTVLDEFLLGFVDKDVFIRDSRPPANWSDYQPLLDFCVRHNLKALSSNCPRRYSRLVSREGRSRLEECLRANEASATLLPPMPYKPASEIYKKKFADIMKQMGNDKADVIAKMADSQALWDATMAHSIGTALTQWPVIFHVAGHFHVSQGLGISEHLGDYAPPDTRCISVVALPEADPGEFSHADVADYIMLTPLDGLE